MSRLSCRSDPLHRLTPSDHPRLTLPTVAPTQSLLDDSGREPCWLTFTVESNADPGMWGTPLPPSGAGTDLEHVSDPGRSLLSGKRQHYGFERAVARPSNSPARPRGTRACGSSYGRGMTSSVTQYVLWVTHEDADDVTDAVLRQRAGVENSLVEVRTERLGRWNLSTVPAGSRDEWGDVMREVLSIGPNQVPPEGRVFVVDMA